MHLFKLEHLNIDELAKAQLESMIQNKSSRIWNFIPHEIIFESINIFQDLIVFCILRDNTGFNLETLSKLPDNTNSEFFNQDLKRSVFSRLSSGESLESLSKKIFDLSLTSEGRSHYFWAYYAFAITHEKCSPRYCLNWIREASTGEHTDIYYCQNDKSHYKDAVDYMVKHIKKSVTNDNSFFNRCDSALLSLNLELGIDAKRID
jgi:hypothetical protein